MEKKFKISTTILIALSLVVIPYFISAVFAAANQGAPGQNFGAPHRNLSGGSPPPGQAHTPPVGNSGQCLKADNVRDLCFPR